MKTQRSLMLAATLLTLSTWAVGGAYDDLIFAANQGDTAKVSDLLRRGMDVNSSDQQGNTLLIIAVREKNNALARYLIENRANPYKRNKYGDAALSLAALQGNEEIVRAMLDRKIDPNQSGWSALHYAAFENRTKIASMLLAAGAEVNALAVNGQTALMIAAKRGHFDTVKLLVAAKADVNEIDRDEGTALDMAKKSGHTQIYDYLKNTAGR